MPYVQRDNGAVIGIYAQPQPGYAEESLADDHPEVVAFLSPPPVAADVISERDRRLALGFDYDFGDVRGVHHIATTSEDMKGWDEVSKLASAAINAGLPNIEITILTNTGPAAVTAAEWQQVLIASAAHRQPIWQASFVLQAMNPIPANYADDAYWA